MQNVHQRPFKTLVTSFNRAIVDEVVASWVDRGLLSLDRRIQSPLTRERNAIEDLDFDLRLMQFANEGFAALHNSQDKEWQRHINRTKEIIESVDEQMEDSWETTLMLDRIDESWDGTDSSVVLVMALMHACVELTANSRAVRPLVFLRENVFERVREVDKEFARLETFVVALDWTREMLLEMIERRLNLSLIANTPAWAHVGRLLRAVVIGRIISGLRIPILSIPTTRCPNLLQVCNRGCPAEASERVIMKTYRKHEKSFLTIASRIRGRIRGKLSATATCPGPLLRSRQTVHSPRHRRLYPETLNGLRGQGSLPKMDL